MFADGDESEDEDEPVSLLDERAAAVDTGADDLDPDLVEAPGLAMEPDQEEQVPVFV
jgi:hypothetical protein